MWPIGLLFYSTFTWFIYASECFFKIYFRNKLLDLLIDSLDSVLRRIGNISATQRRF